MRFLVLSTCLFIALITYVAPGIELANAVGEAIACVGGSCEIGEYTACIGKSCAAQISNSTGTFASPENSNLNPSTVIELD